MPSVKCVGCGGVRQQETAIELKDGFFVCNSRCEAMYRLREMREKLDKQGMKHSRLFGRPGT